MRAAVEKKRGGSSEPAKPLGENAQKAQEPAGEKPPGAAATAPLTQPVITPEQQRAFQDAIRAERQAYEEKQERKRLEEELKQLRDAESKRKNMTPLELLELERGTTLDQVHEDIVKGKYKAKTPEQLAIESAKSELQQLREWKEAQEREKSEATKSAERQTQAAALSKELKELYSKQYPMLSADPDAGMQLVQLKEQHPDATWDQVAAHLEQERAKTVRQAFVSEASIDALLADPDIKARMLTKLGIKSEQQPQQVNEGRRQGNGPEAIPSTRAAESSRVATPRVGGAAGRQAAVLAAVEKKRLASMG